MNKVKIAKQLLVLARELVSMEFDTEEAKKKYEQEHDVRPGTKLTVTKSESSGGDGKSSGGRPQSDKEVLKMWQRDWDKKTTGPAREFMLKDHHSDPSLAGRNFKDLPKEFHKSLIDRWRQLDPKPSTSLVTDTQGKPKTEKRKTDDAFWENPQRSKADVHPEVDFNVVTYPDGAFKIQPQVGEFHLGSSVENMMFDKEDAETVKSLFKKHLGDKKFDKKSSGILDTMKSYQDFEKEVKKLDVSPLYQED